MESIYKVGDEVLVKSKLDDNYKYYDYPFNFIEDMLHIYGGKIYKIKKIFLLHILKIGSFMKNHMVIC